MVKYQKSNLITLEDSDSGGSDQNDKDGIPKLYSKTNNKVKHKIKIDEFIVR